jgi:hypothetical protein
MPKIPPRWLPWWRRIESARTWNERAAYHQKEQYRAAVTRLLGPAELAAPEHRPLRPSWECGTCGQEWPCDPAPERLAAEHSEDFLALSILLWAHLEDFIRDSVPGPFGGAYERFIAWSRPAGRAAAR